MSNPDDSNNDVEGNGWYDVDEDDVPKDDGDFFTFRDYIPEEYDLGDNEEDKPTVATNISYVAKFMRAGTPEQRLLLLETMPRDIRLQIILAISYVIIKEID